MVLFIPTYCHSWSIAHLCGTSVAGIGSKTEKIQEQALQYLSIDLRASYNVSLDKANRPLICLHD